MTIYNPPKGEYVRPPGIHRIDDPRKTESFDSHYVRGAYFHKAAFKALHDRQIVDVELVPEQGNPYDKWAVALHVDRKRIGYIGSDYASLWQDIVRAFNRSGKTVVAPGIIVDAEGCVATAFLPWLRWAKPYGPEFHEECAAITGALSSGESDALLGIFPTRHSSATIARLQGLANLAPSLNWGSQDPGEDLPIQLVWHLLRIFDQRQTEKRESDELLLKQQRAEAFQLRAEDRMSFVAIAAKLGCSPGIASKRYRQHLEGLAINERNLHETLMAEGDSNFTEQVLAMYAEGSSVGSIASSLGSSHGTVSRTLKDSGVLIIDRNAEARRERLERCREACRLQSQGYLRRDIAATIGVSAGTVKILLKDGKFFDAPATDSERLSNARRSRPPELSLLDAAQAARILGMTEQKLLAARKDHAMLVELYGESF